MFNRKRQLAELESLKREIQLEREKLAEEKEQLLFIKEQLEDKSPKMDFSNIYVWEDKGLYSLVRMEVSDFVGRRRSGSGPECIGHKSILIDIFTGDVVYQKSSTEYINEYEYITNGIIKDSYYAKFYPVWRKDKSLLAYPDKKCPLYVLEQLYYKLNKVDVNSQILKKKK